MSEQQVVDSAWVDAHIAAIGIADKEPESPEVGEMQRLLVGWAEAFSHVRPDVQSDKLALSGRGLLHDEARSFLNAVRDGSVKVDDTGHFTLTCARTKSAGGQYSLLSKNGSGVALNLEYVIQVGATAELAREHGWPKGELDFERGEFDTLGYGPDGRVLLAMEAKCRARGSDRSRSCFVSGFS